MNAPNLAILRLISLRKHRWSPKLSSSLEAFLIQHKTTEEVVALKYSKGHCPGFIQKSTKNYMPSKHENSLVVIVKDMTRLLSLTFSRAGICPTNSVRHDLWLGQRRLHEGKRYWKVFADREHVLEELGHRLLYIVLRGRGSFVRFFEWLLGRDLQRYNTMILMKNYRMNFYSIFDCTTGNNRLHQSGIEQYS